MEAGTGLPTSPPPAYSVTLNRKQLPACRFTSDWCTTGTDLGSKKGNIIHWAVLMEKVLRLLSAFCVLLWQTSKARSARKQALGTEENRKKMLEEGKWKGQIRFKNWSCNINKSHLHFKRLLLHERAAYPAVLVQPEQFRLASPQASHIASRVSYTHSVDTKLHQLRSFKEFMKKWLLPECFRTQTAYGLHPTNSKLQLEWYYHFI